MGGTIGILRGRNPLLRAIAGGLQNFTSGAVFWGVRRSLLTAGRETPIVANRDGAAHGDDVRGDGARVLTSSPSPTPDDAEKLRASVIAGAVAGGTTGLLFMGRSNFLPGIVMFALFGGGGQMAVSRWGAGDEEEEGHDQTARRGRAWRWLGERSWVPFRMLGDEEYAGMLREKMMRVDAEVELLDEKLAALEKEEKEQQPGE